LAATKKSSTSNLAAAGGTLFIDQVVESFKEITVIGDLGPTATAAGDVSIKVQPFLADVEDVASISGSDSDDAYQSVGLADAGLDLVQTTIYPGVAAYLASGHSRVMQRLDVAGFIIVRVILTNNNATTALPARLDVFAR
jgi:hypothetical protein